MTGKASVSRINSSKISLGVLLLFAFYIFPIAGRNYRVISYGIIYILPVIFLVMKYGYVKKHLPLNNYNIINAALLLLMLSLSVCLPAVRGTDDYNFIWTVLGIVRYFIRYFFLAVVVSRVHGEKMAVTMFMKYYAISSAIYVIFSAIFYFLPSAASAWISFWNFSQLDFMNLYGYTFRFGWTGFSGFRATYSCSIAVVFLLFLYFEKNNDYIKPLKTSEFTVLFFLNLLGNMFYGRVGIVVFAAEILIAIILYHRIRWGFLFTAVIILSLFAVLLSVILKNNTEVKEWFTWMSSPFLEFIKTGETSNHSYNHLVNDMYFMPEFKTFVIGDARYIEPGTSHYYMRTDGGYMRQILFWGITGAIVSYGFILHALKKISKYKQFKLAVLMLVCFVLYEFKGEVFYEMIPLLIVISYLFEWKDCFDTKDNPPKERLYG